MDDPTSRFYEILRIGEAERRRRLRAASIQQNNAQVLRRELSRPAAFPAILDD